MGTWRIRVAYDGGSFRGWARQPGLRTVQGELESALAIVLRQPVRLTVAGRTDAGVHAWEQVASFELPGPDQPRPESLRRSLNAITPEAIAITEAAPAPDRFDARRDALSRLYCYRVQAGSPASPFERGRALWWPYPLDRPALHACAAALRGKHDFTAFTPTKTDHVRFEREILAASWIEEPTQREGASIFAFWIEADAFMRSMVRTLVGTMLEVGGARRSITDFESLLQGAPRARAGDTAPAHGLYLAAVRYGPQA